MQTTSKTLKLRDARPLDGKRNPRAKNATVARKRQRAAKLAMRSA